MNGLIFICFAIIFPMLVGLFVLPFTPYIVESIKYKNLKGLPSFTPYWLTVILLVLGANWIWTNIFNGRLFYEWDNLFIQYSLTFYQPPVLDSSPSWIAPGLTLWHLYFLWLGITILIYSLSASFCFWIYRKHKHIKEYKEIIVKSTFGMLIVSILSLPFTYAFFWFVRLLSK